MILTHRSKKCSVPLAFSWSHAGVSYRVTPWPDVQFECRYSKEWVPFTPSPDVLAGAMTRASAEGWRSYVEFAPADVREFLGYFRANRLAALQVAARCPELVSALVETPALTAFIAEHAQLRGTSTARWDELNAVCERSGVYGVLDWLGLPASRKTLEVLRNVVAADLSPALLLPLRRILWHPTGIFGLAQLPVITDRDLNAACHALAA